MPMLLPLFVAFSLTLASIFLLRPLAVRLGLVDMPGGRKQHEGNVPLIGGVAMFFGFSFALLTLNISLSPYRCLIACASLLVLTGLLDDFHELTPRSRLFIQIFVGVLVIWWGNAQLHYLGNLFALGQINLGLLAMPITIFAVVTVINAFNMIDGTDGLAGSVALVEFFYLAWIAQRGHMFADQQIIYLIIIVLLAFLCVNFPWRQRASVFMGDSGSMLLGFLLVWFCITLSQAPNNAARPVTFLWVLAVPLWDISSVIIRRIRKGRSPFLSDRGHLHHYLLRRLFSPLQVSLIISAVSAILGLIGLAGEHFIIPESIMFSSFLALFIVYLYLLRLGWQKLDK